MSEPSASRKRHPTTAHLDEDAALQAATEQAREEAADEYAHAQPDVAQPDVARLEADAAPVKSKNDLSEAEIRTLGARLMKRGPSKRKLLRQLSEATGKSQVLLRDLAEDIWEDNRSARRTNAFILIGVGAVLILGGTYAAFQLEVTLALSGLPLLFGIYVFGTGLYEFYQIGRE